MKKLTLITLILGCTLFASCQDKKEYKPACEFNFEAKPYSYKGYDVISYHAVWEDRAILHPGDNYIVMHGDRLDSLTFVNIETEIKRKDNRDHTYYLPIFKEKPAIKYLGVISYFFRGFKSYNHNFQSIDIGVGQRPDPSGSETEIELNGKKYTLQMIYDEPTEGVLENLGVFITYDGNKQCILKVSKLDVKNSDNVQFLELGDLDGDDKLDCILRAIKTQDEIKKDCIFYLMYLSSEAENGDLVKHVATSYYMQDIY